MFRWSDTAIQMLNENILLHGFNMTTTKIFISWRLCLSCHDLIACLHKDVSLFPLIKLHRRNVLFFPSAVHICALKISHMAVSKLREKPGTKSYREKTGQDPINLKFVCV